ncbi:M24 family metallopeptidase, partial [Candidatus Daviesbacteria bacterium]|nr:M24 family metallopeptidase [Candidatus Daviesbacteria bacterium]
VRSLVGHGIGRKLHEDPEVPGFGKAGRGLPLKKGQTLAVEAIYNQGGHEVTLEKDGWTISTKDGSWGGLFEMTVVVDNEEAEVLTDWRKY